MATNKQTYNSRRQRFLIADALVPIIAEMLSQVKEARKNEMTFAGNEEVDTGDFDNLKIKLEELLQAAITLGTENFEPFSNGRME